MKQAVVLKLQLIFIIFFFYLPDITNLHQDKLVKLICFVKKSRILFQQA